MASSANGESQSQEAEGGWVVGELLGGVAAGESLCPCHGWLHGLGLGYPGHMVLPPLYWKQVPGAEEWQLKQMLPSLEGGCISK